jgi:hypothetical protein
VEAVDDGPRPFTALLDTGLKRTSTGSKVFAALKVSVELADGTITVCPAASSLDATEWTPVFLLMVELQLLKQAT